MVIKEEQERVRTLLSDTITLLCRNGLTFKSEFNISALIGITLDKDEVFLVDIRETIKNEATVEEEPAEQSDASSTVSTDKKSHKKRKRRRNKSKDKGGGGDSVANSDQEDVEQLHSDGDEPPEKNVKHEDDDNDSEDLVFVKNEPANPAISINNSLQDEQYGSSAMPQAYRDMNSWDAANMSAGLPSTSSNMAAGQPLSLGDVTQISPVNTSSAAAQKSPRSTLQDFVFACVVCNFWCTRKHNATRHAKLRHSAEIEAGTYSCLNEMVTKRVKDNSLPDPAKVGGKRRNRLNTNSENENNLAIITRTKLSTPTKKNKEKQSKEANNGDDCVYTQESSDLDIPNLKSSFSSSDKKQLLNPSSDEQGETIQDILDGMMKNFPVETSVKEKFLAKLAEERNAKQEKEKLDNEKEKLDNEKKGNKEQEKLKYECGLCGKIYSGKILIAKHMAEHLGTNKVVWSGNKPLQPEYNMKQTHPQFEDEQMQEEQDDFNMQVSPPLQRELTSDNDGNFVSFNDPNTRSSEAESGGIESNNEPMSDHTSARSGLHDEQTVADVPADVAQFDKVMNPINQGLVLAPEINKSNDSSRGLSDIQATDRPSIVSSKSEICNLNRGKAQSNVPVQDSQQQRDQNILPISVQSNTQFAVQSSALQAGPSSVRQSVLSSETAGSIESVVQNMPIQPGQSSLKHTGQDIITPVNQNLDQIGSLQIDHGKVPYGERNDQSPIINAVQLSNVIASSVQVPSSIPHSVPNKMQSIPQNMLAPLSQGQNIAMPPPMMVPTTRSSVNMTYTQEHQQQNAFYRQDSPRHPHQEQRQPADFNIFVDSPITAPFTSFRQLLSDDFDPNADDMVGVPNPPPPYPFAVENFPEYSSQHNTDSNQYTNLTHCNEQQQNFDPNTQENWDAFHKHAIESDQVSSSKEKSNSKSTDGDHTCDICNATFKNTMVLTKHKRKCHNEVMPMCKVCNQTFSIIRDLQKHSKDNHPNSCFYCGIELESKEYLQNHIRDKHLQPVDLITKQCAVCKQPQRTVESLRKHMLVEHRLGCTYLCHLCESEYTLYESLKRHQKKSHGLGRKAEANARNEIDEGSLQEIGESSLMGPASEDQKFNMETEIDLMKDSYKCETDKIKDETSESLVEKSNNTDSNSTHGNIETVAGCTEKDPLSIEEDKTDQITEKQDKSVKSSSSKDGCQLSNTDWTSPLVNAECTDGHKDELSMKKTSTICSSDVQTNKINNQSALTKNDKTNSPNKLEESGKTVKSALTPTINPNETLQSDNTGLQNDSKHDDNDSSKQSESDCNVNVVTPVCDKLINAKGEEIESRDLSNKLEDGDKSEQDSSIANVTAVKKRFVGAELIAKKHIYSVCGKEIKKGKKKPVQKIIKTDSKVVQSEHDNVEPKSELRALNTAPHTDDNIPEGTSKDEEAQHKSDKNKLHRGKLSASSRKVKSVQKTTQEKFLKARMFTRNLRKREADKIAKKSTKFAKAKASKIGTP